MAFRYAAALLVLGLLAVTAYTTLSFRIERSGFVNQLHRSAGDRALLVGQLGSTIEAILDLAMTDGGMPDLVDKFRNDAEVLNKRLEVSLAQDMAAVENWHGQRSAISFAHLFQNDSDYVVSHRDFAGHVSRIVRLDMIELLSDVAVWEALELASVASSPLRQSIDSMVADMEQAATNELVALEARHRQLFMLTVVTLLLEAGFVFVPMIYQARREAARADGAESKLRYAARHDRLTGAGNRLLLSERFEAIAGKTSCDGVSAAVLLLNLDSFRRINAGMGRDVGDRLLTVIVERCRSLVDCPDNVFRHGNDEFVLLLEVSGPKAAIDAGKRLRDIIAQPISIADQSIESGVTMGLACSPDHGETLGELLLAAELALDEGKRNQRGQMVLFSDSLKTDFERQKLLERALRQAIDDHKLTMVFQPIVDIVSGQHRGFEALARWHDDQLGYVSPGEFVPVAERAGMDTDMTWLILNLVTKQMADWVAAELDPGYVTVNLSDGFLAAETIADGLIDFVDRSGVGRERLVVEVTERVAINVNDGKVIANLAALQASGIRIALDDFGTGFATLSQLSQHYFNYIKIDRSFVQDIHRNDEHKAVVTSILDLGHRLGSQVVVEGVETSQERDCLIGEGGQLAQGYYFHKPMAAQDCTPYLQQANSRSARQKAVTPA